MFRLRLQSVAVFDLGVVVHQRVKALYGMAFRDRYSESRGQAFQDFFSEIMERAFPEGDFVRVRPWGNEGDRKNDGYIRSQRRLFALYGPMDATGAEIIAKLKSDFDGAFPYWEKYFSSYVFVHNDPTGIGPSVARTIMELDGRSTDLSVTQWGRTPLQDICMGLKDQHLYELFPGIPGLEDFIETGLAQILPLLEHLTRAAAPSRDKVHPVPINKIEYNQLSDDVRNLIQLGLTPAGKVRRYFTPVVNNLQRDLIAEALRAKYNSLRAAGLMPDDIFLQLKHHIGGIQAVSPSHEVATYGILTYFFEECDIFLRPEERAS